MTKDQFITRLIQRLQMDDGAVVIHIPNNTVIVELGTDTFAMTISKKSKERR